MLVLDIETLLLKQSIKLMIHLPSEHGLYFLKMTNSNGFNWVGST